jgi:hypothetical protein
MRRLYKEPRAVDETFQQYEAFTQRSPVGRCMEQRKDTYIQNAGSILPSHRPVCYPEHPTVHEPVVYIAAEYALMLKKNHPAPL